MPEISPTWPILRPAALPLREAATSPTGRWSPLVAGQFDVIVNFAAESHVDRSILDSGPFVRTNVVGTQCLLDAARAAKVTRFVQVSTDEVYGSLGPTRLHARRRRWHPNSPYAASKAAADLLVRPTHHTFGLDAVITRCSNNYGPYQFPEKLIPLFITNLLADSRCRSTATACRSATGSTCSDHAAGVGGRLEGPGRRGLQLRRPLRAVQHRSDPGADRPARQAASAHPVRQDRPGHDRRYAIDCSKAEAELGWRPIVPFDRGLAETVEWYRSHARWVERVHSGAYRSSKA